MFVYNKFVSVHILEAVLSAAKNVKPEQVETGSLRVKRARLE